MEDFIRQQKQLKLKNGEGGGGEGGPALSRAKILELAVKLKNRKQDMQQMNGAKQPDSGNNQMNGNTAENAPSESKRPEDAR